MRLFRFLLGKFADMQTFAGESMTAEGGMAFGYYKEGAHNPTFAYISKALEAEKVHNIVTFFCGVYRRVRTTVVTRGRLRLGSLTSALQLMHSQQL